MKVIKGEKYLCSNGPKSGQLFRILGFTPYHVVCQNLSYPLNGEELIVKYYFKESFREYNHAPNVRLDGLAIQQVSQAVTKEVFKYVEGGVISDSVFRLIANDIGNILMGEFFEERL